MSDLSAKEQDNVRIAIRVLRLRCQGWEPLARALRCEPDTLGKVMRGARAVTERLTFRVARLADVSVDELLVGSFLPPGTCPHCGKRVSDFGDELTIVEGELPR